MGREPQLRPPDTIKISGSRTTKPFLEVRALQSQSRSEIEIVVQLPEGWYQFEYARKSDRAAEHCGDTHIHRQATSIVADVPQLRIEYTSVNDGCEHDGNGHSRCWG